MKAKQRSGPLPVVHSRAAGIDIGSRFHVVAVPPELSAEPVQTFQAFTGDLVRLAKWLAQVGVTTVAMESTSVYWVPVYEVLEEHGLDVVLANARDVKTVPGRKSDVNDAQWLQRLHACGLIRGSVQPERAIAPLRSYLRLRQRHSDYAAAHIQHMQKSLTLMNLQLHHVVTDITGMTGMKIIRAIIGGERDPEVLAQFRAGSCKASVETIKEALVGNYQPEHLFALKHAVELYDFYQERIAECDEQIRVALESISSEMPSPADPLPKVRTKSKTGNPLSFDSRPLLHQLFGIDLTQIPGVGPLLALRLLSECGRDLSRWPTAKHFTSWLALAPGCKISGGKVLSSHTRKSAHRICAHLRLAASSVGRTSTALGAFYRRLASRIGKAKAITATARKLAIYFYNAVRFGKKYQDMGANYYETRYRQRVVRQLQRRAAEFGYTLHATGEGVS